MITFEKIGNLLIYLINAMAILTNFVTGFIEHDSFYISIAILFTVIMYGEKLKENKKCT